MALVNGLMLRVMFFLPAEIHVASDYRVSRDLASFPRRWQSISRLQCCCVMGSGLRGNDGVGLPISVQHTHGGCPRPASRARVSGAQWSAGVSRDKLRRLLFVGLQPASFALLAPHSISRPINMGEGTSLLSELYHHAHHRHPFRRCSHRL